MKKANAFAATDSQSGEIRAGIARRALLRANARTTRQLLLKNIAGHGRVRHRNRRITGAHTMAQDQKLTGNARIWIIVRSACGCRCEATMENGCMQFVPAYEWDVKPHHSINVTRASGLES